MLGQNHYLALKFDGKLVSLARFLNEIEQLAKDCGLSAKQTINWTLWYTPNDEYKLWAMQDAVGARDWEQFK